MTGNWLQEVHSRAFSLVVVQNAGNVEPLGARICNRVSRLFFGFGFPVFFSGFPHFSQYFDIFCFFLFVLFCYLFFFVLFFRILFPLYFFPRNYFPVLFQTSRRLKSNVLKYKLVVFLVHVVITQFMFLAE